MTIEEWKAQGRALVLEEAAIHWKLGDWILSAQAEWGDMYKLATEATGIPYGTLATYARLAKAYPSDKRHFRLTQSHYFEALRLPVEQREVFLERAERESIQARVFRMVVTDENRKSQDRSGLRSWPAKGLPSATAVLSKPKAQQGIAVEACCPKCGHEFIAYG